MQGFRSPEGHLTKYLPARLSQDQQSKTCPTPKHSTALFHLRRWGVGGGIKTEANQPPSYQLFVSLASGLNRGLRDLMAKSPDVVNV